eukprot:PhF_6_TR13376/c0_g1_i2/m.21231
MLYGGVTETEKSNLLEMKTQYFQACELSSSTSASTPTVSRLDSLYQDLWTYWWSSPPPPGTNLTKQQRIQTLFDSIESHFQEICRDVVRAVVYEHMERVPLHLRTVRRLKPNPNPKPNTRPCGIGYYHEGLFLFLWHPSAHHCSRYERYGARNVLRCNLPGIHVPLTTYVQHFSLTFTVMACVSIMPATMHPIPRAVEVSFVKHLIGNQLLRPMSKSSSVCNPPRLYSCSDSSSLKVVRVYSLGNYNCAVNRGKSHHYAAVRPEYVMNVYEEGGSDDDGSPTSSTTIAPFTSHEHRKALGVRYDDISPQHTTSSSLIFDRDVHFHTKSFLREFIESSRNHQAENYKQIKERFLEELRVYYATHGISATVSQAIEKRVNTAGSYVTIASLLRFPTSREMCRSVVDVPLVVPTLEVYFRRLQKSISQYYYYCSINPTKSEVSVNDVMRHLMDAFQYSRHCYGDDHPFTLLLHAVYCAVLHRAGYAASAVEEAKKLVNQDNAVRFPYERFAMTSAEIGCLVGSLYWGCDMAGAALEVFQTTTLLSKKNEGTDHLISYANLFCVTRTHAGLGIPMLHIQQHRGGHTSPLHKRTRRKVKKTSSSTSSSSGVRISKLLLTTSHMMPSPGKNIEDSSCISLDESTLQRSHMKAQETWARRVTTAPPLLLSPVRFKSGDILRCGSTYGALMITSGAIQDAKKGEDVFCEGSVVGVRQQQTTMVAVPVPIVLRALTSGMAWHVPPEGINARNIPNHGVTIKRHNWNHNNNNSNNTSSAVAATQRRRTSVIDAEYTRRLQPLLNRMVSDLLEVLPEDPLWYLHAWITSAIRMKQQQQQQQLRPKQN